jgi:hypothetical protein
VFDQLRKHGAANVHSDIVAGTTVLISNRFRSGYCSTSLISKCYDTSVKLSPDSSECRYILELLGKVYQNDASAREKAMTPPERLKLHQTESAR